ncbi:MAG: dTDP-4-dehydrorhamnose 3,5-epimerase [Bacteroidetes bacterium CG_4_10_14_3_um_filter_31_20]|nr:MAG: dTDP-4-dehydrorhamnose 3,5-epimerase [Bacteroidetes bacterium CG_4_10_14_3_um_filter_31_20]
MDFTETKLKGAFIINANLLEDDRGGFARIFCKNEFKKIGHNKEFVQINQSYNIKSGTLRGMHYQEPPYSEIKLIRCIKGVVYDVIIDLRQSSPTFLKWVGLELSKKNKKMLYIPEGFAHGFLTLEDNSELIYHHTNFYEPSAERGIRFDDKIINIKWSSNINCISEKDRDLPLLTSNFKGINI